MQRFSERALFVVSRRDFHGAEVRRSCGSQKILQNEDLLGKSASIQPRTSPPTFVALLLTSTEFLSLLAQVPGQRVFCPSFPASSEMQSITNRSEEILFGSWETDTDDDDDRAIRVALKSYSLRKDSQNVTKRSDETELKTWFTNRKFLSLF